MGFDQIGGTLSTVITIVIIVVFIGVFGVIALFAAKLAKLLNLFINDVLLVPLRRLQDFLEDLSETILPHIVFGASVIVLIVSVFVYWDPVIGFTGFLQKLFLNTTFGAFIESITQLTSGDFTITVGSILSIGLTSYLTGLCLEMEENSDHNVFIKILYNLVIMLAFPLFALLTSGVLDAIGNWGYQSIVLVFDMGSVSFFVKAGRILLLILLAYPTVLLLSIVVHEYLASIYCGVLVFLAAAIIENLLAKWGVPELVNNLIFLSLIFVTEYFRDEFEEFLSENVDFLA